MKETGNRRERKSWKQEETRRGEVEEATVAHHPLFKPRGLNVQQCQQVNRVQGLLRPLGATIVVGRQQGEGAFDHLLHVSARRVHAFIVSFIL